ncbi:MAG: hypothetical protein AAFQ01_02580, partial [Bacteroidota bacterium]
SKYDRYTLNLGTAKAMSLGHPSYSNVLEVLREEGRNKSFDACFFHCIDACHPKNIQPTFSWIEIN